MAYFNINQANSMFYCGLTIIEKNVRNKFQDGDQQNVGDIPCVTGRVKGIKNKSSSLHSHVCLYTFKIDVKNIH